MKQVDAIYNVHVWISIFAFFRIENTNEQIMPLNIYSKYQIHRHAVSAFSTDWIKMCVISWKNVGNPVVNTLNYSFISIFTCF